MATGGECLAEMVGKLQTTDIALDHGVVGNHAAHWREFESSSLQKEPVLDDVFAFTTVSEDFDCLVCANDITAGQVIKSLKSLSIRVPTDVRVAGFDDLRHATLLPVALTTIHQPCREIAEMAFRVLLERLTTPRIPPRTITAAPRLVVRESCGAYERKG